MPTVPLRVVAALALLALPAIGSADELHLKNGDRYTGRVVQLTGGTLKFDTGHGTVSVPWTDVSTLDVPELLQVIVRNNPPHVERVRSVESGGFVLEPDGFIVPFDDLIGLARIEPFVVGGDANAGVLASAGNSDVNSLHADGEVIARTTNNRYTMNATVNRASNAGVLNDDKASGTLRYDRFFNPRFYANGNAILTHDQFRDLRLRTALGLALGYQVFDNHRVRLGTELGYGYVSERLSNAPSDRYEAGRDSVDLNVFVVGRRVSMFHRHDGFFGLVGSHRLFVQTHNGVRVVLIGGLVATLEYDVDYDRAALPGRRLADHTAGLTFGYRFGRT